MEQLLTAALCLVDIIKDNETLPDSCTRGERQTQNQNNINVSYILRTPARSVQTLSQIPRGETSS